LLEASGARLMEIQSNDALLAVMLHTYARDIRSEKIVFRDGVTTALESSGAVLEMTTGEEDTRRAVAEPFRRRGFGAYLVQELKRAAYELGSIPGARCSRRHFRFAWT
jgi:GNAT superfamily N-acetyltransferase